MSPRRPDAHPALLRMPRSHNGTPSASGRILFQHVQHPELLPLFPGTQLLRVRLSWQIQPDGSLPVLARVNRTGRPSYSLIALIMFINIHWIAGPPGSGAQCPAPCPPCAAHTLLGWAPDDAVSHALEDAVKDVVVYLFHHDFWAGFRRMNPHRPVAWVQVRETLPSARTALELPCRRPAEVVHPPVQRNDPRFSRSALGGESIWRQSQSRTKFPFWPSFGTVAGDKTG